VPGPRVAYALREFPHPSETFIAHEILELERQGVPLRIFSYRRPRSQPPHEVFRQIATRVEYLPDPIPRHLSEIARAHRAVYRRGPARYRRVARYALTQAFAERDIDALRRFAHAGCLADRLAGSDVEHLHAHFARGATRLVMLASMLIDLPFSFTAHARDIFANDVRPPLLREQIDRAAFVVTVCDYNRDFLVRETGASPDKIRVVRNGVDLEKFAPDAAVPREVGFVLAVGRLVEKKGFLHLIEAVRLLREGGVALRCEITGDGPERGRLAEAVRVAGLEAAVQLTGGASQETLVDLYRRASVLALPAIVAANGNRDALPTVLLEAMACGTPVVSTRLAGIPEIVEHGVDGLLVEPGDAPALARALEALLTDASLRARLAAAARAKVEARFDLRTSASALRELFAHNARETMAAVP